MSVNESELKPGEQPASAAAAVPKRIVNAQTVCNEKNEKGKLCNGHLKQLRTAGEPAEIHLRGDDVLSKCQTCGTLYMGPPLGHVRDPNKQHRFVEAELTALLQAAGGTLPVVKKDARGVFVLVEAGGEHGATLAASKPTPPAAKPVTPAAPTAAQTTSAPAGKPVSPPPAATAPAGGAHKAGSEPNRSLFRRSTYSGVQDTGPVPGETFEQKVARLKAVAAAAKQRAEETGGQTAPAVPATAVEVTPVEATPPPVETPAAETTVPPAVTPAAPPSSAVHQSTGQADRTLMRRSTYCGVVDTGPVAGETFAQKVERLSKLAAAAKQRAEGG